MRDIWGGSLYCSTVALHLPSRIARSDDKRCVPQRPRRSETALALFEFCAPLAAHCAVLRRRTGERASEAHYDGIITYDSYQYHFLVGLSCASPHTVISTVVKRRSESAGYRYTELQNRLISKRGSVSTVAMRFVTLL